MSEASSDLERDGRPQYFDSMNEMLARLHTVDYRQIGLTDYGRPGNYIARQIERWSCQYRQDTEAGANAACDVYGTAADVDKEQHVVGDQASERTDLDGEEIGCRYTFPVSLQKGRPRCALAALWGRFDPVVLENLCDRTSSDLVTQIGERTLDAIWVANLAGPGYGRVRRRSLGRAALSAGIALTSNGRKSSSEDCAGGK